MVKIGFEFECISKYFNDVYDISGYHSYNEIEVEGVNWRFETDGSLSDYGVEIISPTFTINEMDKIKKSLITIIKDVKNADGYTTIDNSCGFHINFSFQDEDFNNRFMDTLIFKRLLYLRDKIFKFVRKNYSEEEFDIFNDYYFRGYAKEVRGIKDYRREKYQEFNIRSNFIEWRSVHLRYLSKYQDEELIKHMFILIKNIFKWIEETVKIKNDTDKVWVYTNENNFYREKTKEITLYFIPNQEIINVIYMKKIVKKRKKTNKYFSGFKNLILNNSLNIRNFQKIKYV